MVVRDKRDEWVYREELKTHIKYIRGKVDDNHDELRSLNGRVRITEKKVTRLETLTGVFSTIISVGFGWLFKKNI